MPLNVALVFNVSLQGVGVVPGRFAMVVHVLGFMRVPIPASRMW
jgi:hypothetical protein